MTGDFPSDALEALDELLEQDTDLETLVAATAALLGCLAGVATAGGVAIEADPQGPCDPCGRPDGALSRLLPDGTTVWLAPLAGGRLPPEASPTATAVLRRFGVAVKVGLLSTATHGRTTDLRVVVDPEAADSDRRSALARLGLRDTATITLMAVAGPLDGVAVLVERFQAQAAVLHHAVEGRRHLIIGAGLPKPWLVGMPLGVRSAFMREVAPLDAPESWRRVRNALRLTQPSTHDSAPYALGEAIVVDAKRVGVYDVLAEQLTAEQLAKVDDVQRLELLCQESGADMRTTLRAVAATDSLRRAATTLHLHHNSVAHRLRRAEKVLGFPCTEPFGRARLLLLLAVYRILESHQHF